MTDIDRELQKIFDQRLSRFQAPAARAPRGPWRAALTVAVATIALALTGLALDVNGTASANGIDCANLMAKVEFWASAKAQAVSKGPSAEQVKAWVADGACAGTAPKPFEPTSDLKPTAPRK